MLLAWAGPLPATCPPRTLQKSLTVRSSFSGRPAGVASVAHGRPVGITGDLNSTDTALQLRLGLGTQHVQVRSAASRSRPEKSRSSLPASTSIWLLCCFGRSGFCRQGSTSFGCRAVTTTAEGRPKVRGTHCGVPLSCIILVSSFDTDRVKPRASDWRTCTRIFPVCFQVTASRSPDQDPGRRSQSRTQTLTQTQSSNQATRYASWHKMQLRNFDSAASMNALI